MRIVDIREAKTQLSKLVEEVAQGEHVVIARAGKPAAMLVPMKHPSQVREPGSMKGRLEFAADFDAPLPQDLQALFEGR